jgi:hypothetical protein
MQKIYLIACLIFIAGNFCTAQIRLPEPSPIQTIKQDFGLGSIEITYSRPDAGNKTVFGEMVPYDQLWRTGANAATKIRFTEPVEIEGKNIDSGMYALYTIPGIDNWDIIINKGANNWGTDGYKESQDVIHFTAAPVRTTPKLESFTIQIDDVKPESCTLNIMWEKTAVSIPIAVNVKDKLRAEIDSAMQTDDKPYWQAAQFYCEYDFNLKKALENVNKAIEGNVKAYWMYLYKANIQKDMGNNAGAMESSERSSELANDAGNDDYVQMNKKLQKELKRLMR